MTQDEFPEDIIAAAEAAVESTSGTYCICPECIKPVANAILAERRAKEERIAALEEKVDNLMSAYVDGYDTAKIEYREYLAAAEAKLSKAVEALEAIAALEAPPAFGDGIFAITSARATLKELGGSDA